MKLIRTLLFILCAVVVNSASAEVGAIPLPGDTRLVVFSYDANNTYTVLARPGAITDIQLSSDESLVALAVGDTIQWIVADSDGHVFIKPTRNDLFTSATLVTSKRTYQLTLKSGSEDAKWYQRVTWNYPEISMLKRVESQKRQELQAAEQKKREEIVLSQGISIDNLNFNYRIEGEAPFKPVQVFDDGKFTYFRIDQKAQELPAMFAVSDDGEGELANYVIKGDYLMLQRLSHSVILKLGKQEVKITRLDKGRSSNFFGGW